MKIIFKAVLPICLNFNNLWGAQMRNIDFGETGLIGRTDLTVVRYTANQQ
jgi:hypothetical protein